MGDRGQGGGWKVPTGLLQLFQRGAPICPPSHLFSVPFSLEALPPQELEDPQMSSRHRETCTDYFLTWRISLFIRCFQWWSRALSGSEIPSCQSLEGVRSYPVLNEQVKDRIQSRLCYWVRWQVMSPFCLAGDWRAHPLSSKSCDGRGLVAQLLLGQLFLLKSAGTWNGKLSLIFQINKRGEKRFLSHIQRIMLALMVAKLPLDLLK